MIKLSFDMEELAHAPRSYQLLIIILLNLMIQASGYRSYLIPKLAQKSRLASEQQEMQFSITKSIEVLVGMSQVRIESQKLAEQTKRISLPFLSQPDMADFVATVSQLGRNRMLTFTRIEVQAENKSDLFNRSPIVIELSGSYFDISAFIGDLARLPQVMVVEQLYWQRSGESSNQLKLRLRAGLYQLLVEKRDDI